MSAYITSEADCRANIRGVCSGCGGQLEPIETVDNARRPTFWAGCKACSTFCGGVDPEVFRIARHLLDRNGAYYGYTEKPKDEDTERMAYWVSSETMGWCDVVAQVLAARRPESGDAPSNTTGLGARCAGMAGESDVNSNRTNYIDSRAAAIPAPAHPSAGSVMGAWPKHYRQANAPYSEGERLIGVVVPESECELHWSLDDLRTAVAGSQREFTELEQAAKHARNFINSLLNDATALESHGLGTVAGLVKSVGGKIIHDQLERALTAAQREEP